MNLQRQYAGTNAELNRLLSRRAALRHKMRLSEKGDRKTRNRALIRAGELLCLTPLPSLCGIESGDDLRDYPDNAALLLGILTEFAERMPPRIPENELLRLKNKGLSLLKQCNLAVGKFRF